MTDTVIDAVPRRPKPTGKVALKRSVQFWFGLAAIGQLIFAYHIVSFYGGAALAGNYEAWGELLPNGYIAGDLIGNLFLGLHFVLAFVITVGGLLQLVPQVRNRSLAFHRWVGRVYVITAFVIATAGLYLKFSRELFESIYLTTGFTLNAVLVLVCAAVAWRYALRRRVQEHRRWAMRLFIVVSGTWFFRVGLMAWIIINQAPVGIDIETFQGPFMDIWAFVHLLLPLALLELYFRVQEKGGVAARFAVAGGLVVMTFVMGAGIAGASMFFWLS